MAYVIWLLIMGVIFGFVAFPVAQRVGYRYGRFGRTGDLVAVVVATVISGVLISLLGTALGAAAGGDAGAIIGGIAGAVLAIALLVIFATKAANDEPTNRQDQIAGPYATSSDSHEERKP